MSINSKREYFGLDGLDQKLEPFVDFDGGTIFEAGANNGVSQSNSLYFERYRGWRAILVEPIPQRFFDCVVNRPEACVEWAALVPIGWAEDTVPLTYCNLMTVTRGTPETRDWEDGHLKSGEVWIPGEKTYDFFARAKTISAILDKYAVTHLDVLSLDIEGFELAALKGIDFERHRPTYMLIEARDDSAIDGFLAPRYERVQNLSEYDSHRDVLYRLRGR